MVRRSRKWDVIRKEGNPTTADEVNALLAKIKKHEVRRQGVESQARRPLEFAEFLNILKIARTELRCPVVHLYRLSSILTLQWHMIGRIDDMMKLQFRNFSVNPHHSFTFFCQMRWSKNVSEERDAPNQHVIASMDERLCSHLNLAAYLELCGDVVAEEDDFLYQNGFDGDRFVRHMLASALQSERFRSLVPGKVGTHSFRKGAVTYASRHGTNKDDIESRGRWRGAKRQVDTYMGIERPIPDAGTACVLCGPSGAIRYKVKDNCSWLSSSFLSTQIAPNSARLLSSEIASLLALPLIYAAIEGVSSSDKEFILLPDNLRRRILNALCVAGGYGDVSIIPQIMERVPIVVSSSSEGGLAFTDLGEDTGSASEPQPGNGTALANYMRATSANQSRIQRRMEELAVNNDRKIEALQRQTQKNHEQIVRLLKRTGILPYTAAHRTPNCTVEDDAQEETPRRPSRLSKRPKDLFLLWKEYQFGLEGNKPARDFSPDERGKDAYTYCFRKNFWEVVATMIRSGETSDTAIDRIYVVYGRNKCVSDILREMRKDKKRGGHPSLRVQVQQG